MTLMNKNQFLYELRGKLKNLPEAEVESAMGYYEEYFLEAGPENEQRIIAELGSPTAVASKIIGEFALSDSPAATKSNSAKTLWIVILALLASPIALPLAIALIAIVFALLIVLLSVPFAFAVTGIALVVAGVAATIIGFGALFVHFGTGIFQTGFGILCAGIGILLTIAAINAFQLIFTGTQKLLGSVLVRKAS
jgi:uncharacterized membrane protein